VRCSALLSGLRFKQVTGSVASVLKFKTISAGRLGWKSVWVVAVLRRLPLQKKATAVRIGTLPASRPHTSRLDPVDPLGNRSLPRDGFACLPRSAEATPKTSIKVARTRLVGEASTCRRRGLLMPQPAMKMNHVLPQCRLVLDELDARFYSTTRQPRAKPTTPTGATTSPGSARRAIGNSSTC